MGKQLPPRPDAGRLSGNSGVKKIDKMKNKKSSGPSSGGGGGGAKGPGREVVELTHSTDVEAPPPSPPPTRVCMSISTCRYLVSQATLRCRLACLFSVTLMPGRGATAGPTSGGGGGGAKSAAAALTPGRVAPPPPTYRLLDWANAAAPAAKVGPTDSARHVIGCQFPQ